MSEMVERVALAVADHLGVNLAFTEAMESDTPVVAACRKADTALASAIARAAIAAMRDIPPEAIDGAWGFGVSDWNAVIDRLLSPAPPSEE